MQSRWVNSVEEDGVVVDHRYFPAIGSLNIQKEATRPDDVTEDLFPAASQTIMGGNNSEPRTSYDVEPVKTAYAEAPAPINNESEALLPDDPGEAARSEERRAPPREDYRATKITAAAPGSFDKALADFKEQRALAANPRDAGETDFSPRDDAADENPKEPEIKLAQNRGGKGPGPFFEGPLADALRKGMARRNARSNERAPLPWGTPKVDPVPVKPATPSMSESFSRIGKDAGPAFDRSSVKWGDVRSFDDLPAYARDVASKLSNNNPRSDIPRFLFKLESTSPKVTNEISRIDKEIGKALAERPAEISNYVVDKLYAKGAEAANKALSELPALLKNGVVHETNERVKGSPRVAIAAPWGDAGDKFIAVLEMSRTGKAVEIVSIHPMQKNQYENRLRATGKLSIGPVGGLLMLHLDEADE